MEKNKIKIIIGIALVLFICTSNVALAVDWWPIVPCGLNVAPDGTTLKDGNGNLHDYTKKCTQCDLFLLAHNIMNFIVVGVMPPLAVLFFVWAGFLILTSAGDASKVTSGQKILTGTIYSIALMLLSWVIANTIIKSLVEEPYAAGWFEFQCTETVEPTSRLDVQRLGQAGISAGLAALPADGLGASPTPEPIQDRDLFYNLYLYYDNGNIVADRDHAISYDISEGSLSSNSDGGDNPYRIDVVSIRNVVLGSLDFSPTQLLSDQQKGKIVVRAPYFANAKEVAIYNNVTQLVIKIPVIESSFCNEDNICDIDVGENYKNCLNDCKESVTPAPTPTPTPVPADNKSSFGEAFLYIFGGLAIVGAWLGFKWWQRNHAR